ncbi:MAG: NAD(+) synthase [Planctomycetes bacterium]|nr:NAD(+) synthase [Planctomycetota bacterium]
MTTTPPSTDAFGPGVLALDHAVEAARITDWLRQTVARTLHRRGAIVAVSGGIDSALCATLAARALGADRVEALFLPEAANSPAAADRARELCRWLGVELGEQEIASPLRELGCYRLQDEAIARVFPDLPPGSPHKITIAGDLLERDRSNLFDLVAQAPDGTLRRARLPLDAYLQLVAATNMKQRVRKLLEYSRAEARNYAVVGTPNRLEYELGFFVRGGDGLADLKPIAHLYKTQVYALAAHLGVPQSIRDQPPSTETYTLPQTQQEFFFALPFDQLDLLLWARDHAVPPARIAEGMGLSPEQVDRALRDIEAKHKVAERLDQRALVPELRR